MTQRPELFKAIVCAVPLLDMLRYHMFGSGKTWIPEYGSADDPDQFKVLYDYSPYRRAVDAGARRYPALLMDSADHDDRVDPLHAVRTLEPEVAAELEVRRGVHAQLAPELAPRLRRVAHVHGLPLDARSVTDEILTLEAR